MSTNKVNRSRKNAITIRMNDKEYEAVKNKIGESTLSQQSFIINAILGATIVSSDEIDILKECQKSFESLERQLRGFATNINQLAHIANAYGNIPSLAQLERILTETKSYREENEKIWQSIRSLISQQRHTEP